MSPRTLSGGSRRRLPSSRPPSSKGAAVVRELRPPKRGVPPVGSLPPRLPTSLPPPPPPPLPSIAHGRGGAPRRDDTGPASALPLPHSAPLPKGGGDGWVGRVISGRYKVVGKLGSGGMGEVYEAEHLTLGKSVALKIIRPELARDEDLAARFAREALASARVEHPRMAMAIDYGPLPEGGAYLVLQRARGRSLLSVLRENGPLSWQQAAEVGAQVADALHAAHTAGIVHRDLKPENLLLDLQADGGMVVWVLDLGIARIEGDPGDPSAPGVAPEALTRVGEVMGTPGYMSPEQAMGEPATPEADLFSLGVILWEMVAGRRLFPGDNLPDILTVQLTEAVPILSLLRPESDVPPGYDDVVQWLLSRRPDNRPHKATLVRDALRSLLGPRDIEWPVPIFGKGWDPLGGGEGMGPKSGAVPAPRSLPPLPPPPPGSHSAPGPRRGTSRPADAPGSALPPPVPEAALDADAGSGFGTPDDVLPAPDAPTGGPAAAGAGSWLPTSILPEQARKQLPAVLLGAGIIAPLFLVGTVFALVMVFVPALLGDGSLGGTPPSTAVSAASTSSAPEGAAPSSGETPAADPGTASPGSGSMAGTPEPAAAGTAPDREETARWIQTLVESRSGSTRRQAARWLLDDSRVDALPAWVTGVATLEVSRGCGSRREALAELRELGDARARGAVARLARTPPYGCGPLDLEDCLQCIRGDLRRTLKALE